MVLTASHRRVLRAILATGPGTSETTKSSAPTKAVRDLVEAGMLEVLNRLRPGPGMYEITAAGRVALAKDPS
jgi:hypothetical protein